VRKCCDQPWTLSWAVSTLTHQRGGAAQPQLCGVCGAALLLTPLNLLQAGRITRRARCGRTTLMTGEGAGRPSACLYALTCSTAGLFTGQCASGTYCLCASPCAAFPRLYTLPQTVPPIFHRLEKYVRSRWTAVGETLLRWNGQVMEPAGESCRPGTRAAAGCAPACLACFGGSMLLGGTDQVPLYCSSCIESLQTCCTCMASTP
jgi:hypothetical protein